MKVIMTRMTILIVVGGGYDGVGEGGDDEGGGVGGDDRDDASAV